MNRLIIVFLATAALALAASPLAAQTDTTFTYQGSLGDGGMPVNGSYNIDVRLWDALSGGTQIGITNTFNGQVVTDGLFTIEIDFGANAFDNSARWLEISVNGNALTPRQPITRSPYSIQTRGITVDEDLNAAMGESGKPVLLDVIGSVMSRGLGGGSFSTRNPNNDNASFSLGWLNDVARIRIGGTGAGSNGGLDIQRTGDASLMRVLHNGRVGIRTTDPLAQLHVESATNVGIRAVSPTTVGTGVHGIATSTSQVNWGVRGESASPVGNGVGGKNDAGGTGVQGEAFGGDLSVGVEGFASGQSSKGVRGMGKTGVLGEGSGAGSVGVEGTSGSSTGSGVVGRSTSFVAAGVGVRGIAGSTGYDFLADWAGVNYGSTSSKRWKSGIETISAPLEIVSRLRGVYFDWDQRHGGHRDIGMIAEEVGEVIPEIVVFEENGIDADGMDYSKLTPLLVEATKALALESQNKDAEIAHLHERVSELESLVHRIVAQRTKED